MTPEQKADHEKRLDEFLAEARRFFLEKEAEPVIFLAIDRDGETVRSVIEDTAPPAVVGCVLNSARNGLSKRVFHDANDRWIRSIDRKVEIKSLREEVKRLAEDLNVQQPGSSDGASPAP